MAPERPEAIRPNQVQFLTVAEVASMMRVVAPSRAKAS